MIAFRLPFAVGLGTLLSLGLFLVLWGFVSRPLDIAPSIKAQPIDFTRLIVDTPVETKRTEKVERTPPPAVPDLPTIGTGSEGDGSAVTLVRNPGVPSIDVHGGGLGAQLSTDVIPLVRVSPDYPPSALARNIEGWVQVQFTVAPTGMVRDVKGVAADPPHVFDQAALRAVERWRYNPMIEDGQPVERVGLQTVIRFQLDH